MEIINFGSLNVDYVYRVSDFTQPGETKAALNYQIFSGGKGLNQSIAAARAGAKIYHAGILGVGGDMLLEPLRQSGVDLSMLERCDSPQGHTVIQVTDTGENCILLFHGSNYAVSPAYIDRVFAQVQPPAFVMLQNEISNVEYIVSKAKEKGFSVVLNASPVDNSLRRLNFHQIDWLMINEVEGEQLTGHAEPDDILASLERQYPHMNILLTLGKAGSVCLSGGIRTEQRCYPVQAVDTTAAGDTYSGYFIAALTAGASVAQAMDNAAKASAIAVTRPGAAPSIPTAEEVRAASF